MSKKMTIGNIRDSYGIYADIQDIVNINCEVEIMKTGNVVLKTQDIIFKSTYEKLKKYFEKFDYVVNSVYPFQNDLVITCVKKKEAD